MAACWGCNVTVAKEVTAAWRDPAYQNEPPPISVNVKTTV